MLRIGKTRFWAACAALGLAGVALACSSPEPFRASLGAGGRGGATLLGGAGTVGTAGAGGPDAAGTTGVRGRYRRGR